MIYDTYHSHPLCIARGLHYAGLTDCAWSSDGKNLIVCSTDGYISILSFGEGEFGEVYTDTTTASLSQSLVTNHQNMNRSTSHHMNGGTRDGTMSKGKNGSIGGGKSISSRKPLSNLKPSSATLPPCEPGQSAMLVAPPSKRARIDHNREKKRVVPTLLSKGGNNTGHIGNNCNGTNEGKDGGGDVVVGGAGMNGKMDTDLKGNMEGEENDENNNKNGNSMETEVVGAVTNLSINNELQGKVNQIRSIC